MRLTKEAWPYLAFLACLPGLAWGERLKPCCPHQKTDRQKKLQPLRVSKGLILAPFLLCFLSKNCRYSHYHVASEILLMRTTWLWRLQNFGGIFCFYGLIILLLNTIFLFFNPCWSSSIDFFNLNPRFLICDHRFFVLDPRFYILDPRFYILDTRFFTLNTRFSIFNPRFFILDPRFFILNPRFFLFIRRFSVHRRYSFVVVLD